MVNVSHASLTGSELHEPKGAASAALGTVYVANGAGSGSWQSVGTSSLTGMIADFPAPVAPAGWLECDGSVISTTTYAGLFAVLSITSSGSKTNGSPVITSISSTTGMKAGYYIFGTGISSGTTILSVDSATQITMSGNSSSTGVSGFFVSPFLLNTGTIALPDFTTAGRYRRSRTSSTNVGQVQADQNKAHTHTGTTSINSVDHTHTYSGTTGNMSANSTHAHSVGGGNQIGTGSNGGQSGGSFFVATSPTTLTIESASTQHTHTFSGTTSGQNASHTHTFTTSSDGGTDNRPLTMVVLTCIKT